MPTSPLTPAMTVLIAALVVGFVVANIVYALARKTNKNSSTFLILSIVNIILLMVLWLVENFGGDNPPGMTLAFSPQIFFGIPSIMLLIISMTRREKLGVGINTLATLFLLVGILDLRMPMYHRPDPNVTPMRVMSYNVEKWQNGASQVAGVIRLVAPDIVCLQEAGDYSNVRGHQPDKLIHALTEYHVVRSGELMVASRFPIVKVEIVPLRPGPSSRPAMKVMVRARQRNLVIINVHLLPSQLADHLRDGKLAAVCQNFTAARRKQNHTVLEMADEIYSPLLICGDFNAQPQTQTCKDLTRRYSDAFDIAGYGFGYTIPSQMPLSRVDHILVSNAIIPTSSWVPDYQISDHRPMVAEFVFNGR